MGNTEQSFYWSGCTCLCTYSNNKHASALMPKICGRRSSCIHIMPKICGHRSSCINIITLICDSSYKLGSEVNIVGFDEMDRHHVISESLFLTSVCTENQLSCLSEKFATK